MLRSLQSLICTALLLGSALHLEASPLTHLNFSLWSEYKRVDFQGLSQEEKSVKLQRLFADTSQFVKKHNIRRLIVRILDPLAFDFFNPENFDSNRDDNFYYWSLKLNAHSEIEALFDSGEFSLQPRSFTTRIYDFFRPEETPFGEFQNLYDKLLWVSIINESFDPSGNSGALIQGITIDPSGEEDAICQNIVNALDQYKSGINEHLPENIHPRIRLAILLDIDQKDFAFANLALFPLRTDLRGEKPNDIGIKTPQNFPSSPPTYLAPEWRGDENRSMLDSVYIRMYDPRLVESIYQNSELLPDPTLPNPIAVGRLSQNLSDALKGTPYIKAPGFISNLKGTSDVQGRYTYFKTGSTDLQEGRLLDGSTIEVRPPYLSQRVRKVVSIDPKNNRLLRITSTFSTTQDLDDAEYYTSPIPMNWTHPRISEKIRGSIYYLFSTDFEPQQGRYFGNWCLENFLKFLYHPQRAKGFLQQRFFSSFSTKFSWAPKNNLVLYDFTTLPNGDPYPECDWKLGNQVY
ncbi:MAG: hypothetical protein K1060chlam2_01316 [Chlamydiae bacterium]|nr:hypothetical protein [Chlamydiota bacterium]